MLRFEPRIYLSAEGTSESGTSESGLPAATPAEAKNTDTKQEHMIPKSRYDDANEKAKEAERRYQELLTEKEARERADREAEEERLRKAGELEELLQREAKKREEADALRKKAEAELAEVRRMERAAVICNKVGFPIEAVSTISGQTEEEMTESAKAQLAIWDRWFKQRQAPPTEGSRGTNGPVAPPQPPEAAQRQTTAHYRRAF